MTAIVYPRTAAKYNLAYGCWKGMKRRAEGRQHRALYADRGIDMDPRWNDFWTFLEDVGERPSEKHSLDRIDNDRGYWPGNVRWALAREQARNSRNYRGGGRRRDWAVIGPDGAVWETAAEAARDLGFSRSSIRAWCAGRIGGWRYEDWVYGLGGSASTASTKPTESSSRGG